MPTAAFHSLCTHRELAPAPANCLQPWRCLRAALVMLPADMEHDRHAATTFHPRSFMSQLWGKPPLALPQLEAHWEAPLSLQGRH